MPRNSPTGFVSAFFTTLLGFALIWHIWWLVIVGLVGAYGVFVAFAWRLDDEFIVPAEEVARLDRERRRLREEYLLKLGKSV
jgi:cytochrome o ubiquinol oxidase subunit 1